jgi:hypothetical protein
MKILEAVKVAEKSKDVKELIGKGFFLNSGMAFLEPSDMEVSKWILTYYEPNKNLVVQAEVEGGVVSLSEKGTPMHPSKEKLDLKALKTSGAKMLEKAKKEFQKYKQPISQVIMSIQMEQERPVWRFNFVTKTLYLVVVRIDAVKGEVLSSEMVTLVK